MPDQGANFDMIIGPWGEDAIAANRSAVGLAYQLTEAGPSLMVIDACARPVAERRKYFFFEKKKQKTFIGLRVLIVGAP